MVTGNFSIRTHPVEVLFNLGATHSFISARLLKIATSTYSLLNIALPDGKVVSYRELFISCLL